jgi:hypothetical protein
MTDDDIAALMRVARRIADGEVFSNQLMGEEGVPVALRILVAATTLAAADHPVTKKAITSSAPAARSAAYRDHAVLLEEAKDYLPFLVQSQLDMAGDGISAVALARQLELANNTIHRERQLRDETERRLQHLVSYTRELHWQLKDERDALVRERAVKVRSLFTVDDRGSEKDDGS